MSTAAARPAVPAAPDRVRLRLLGGVVAYAVAVAIAARALDEAALVLALRLQARLSFALFIAAIIGRGLHARAPGRATAWLARHRPSLMLAFALSHWIHATWIVLFFRLTPAQFSWNVVDLSGVLAFPVIALLAYLEISSDDPAVASSGPGRKRLTQLLVAYVWIQFVGFFFDRLTTSGQRPLYPWYVLAIAISVAAAWLARPTATAHPRATMPVPPSDLGP